MILNPFAALSADADQKPSPLPLKSPTVKVVQTAEFVLSRECVAEIVMLPSFEIHVGMNADGSPDFSKTYNTGKTAIKLAKPNTPGCNIRLNVRRLETQ